MKRLISLLFLISLPFYAVAGDYSQQQAWVTGETITAAKLNIDIQGLISTVNDLSNDNIASNAAIIGTKLDLSAPGNIGATVAGTGAFSTLTVTNAITEFSKDGTMGGNSDSALPTEKAVKTYTDASIPSGVIVMWSGAVSAIPSGWVICDGNNSTPDLEDRFVIHADADSGGTNDVGDTGGAKTVDIQHNHSGATGADGSHTHNINSGSVLASGGEDYAIATNDPGNHTHTIGNDGSTTQSVRDLYYALAYIMKS